MIKIHILSTCTHCNSEACPLITSVSTDLLPTCTTTASLNNRLAS